jgi:hypothetical protein
MSCGLYFKRIIPLKKKTNNTHLESGGESFLLTVESSTLTIFAVKIERNKWRERKINESEQTKYGF